MRGKKSRNMVRALENVLGLSIYNLTGKISDFQSFKVGSSPIM